MPILGTAVGRVVWWNPRKGIGVLRSETLIGDVIVFFSEIEGSEYTDLSPGQEVEFAYEPGQQGYPFRARRVRIL